MKEHILELEKGSRQLDPGSLERKAWLHRAAQYADDFIAGIETRRTFYPPSDAAHFQPYSVPGENGIPLDELIPFIEQEVDRTGLNPASGGHLGYIPGGGIFASAVGDFMTDVANNYAGVFFAGPGAVRMENALLRWIASEVEYPPTAGGNLASGGSIANLIAIVAARDAHGIKAADFHRSVFYLSEQAHHCIHKAIRVCGMGEAIIRTLPLDERFRIQPGELEKLVQEDKAAGLLPFLVVATAGTTDTGAVDPVPEIAAIAKAHHLWLHIDAAYGGFFVLCEEGRAAIKGLGLSDSIVLDPHKTLFLPYGTGAVLVKEVKHLMKSQYYLAPYLQDAASFTEEISPADVSPELTKPFRGLRMWLPLMLHGLKPFRAALSEKIWLCRYFYEEVQKIPGMMAGPYPELSVAIFRYAPEGRDAEAATQQLMKAIHADGRVFLSSTRIRGETWIRIAVVAHRTHLSTVESALQMIRECAEKIRD